MPSDKSKDRTLSVREDEETFEWFEKYAENELGASKSEVIRDFIERLEKDPMYRAFHTDLYRQNPEDFGAFLEEADEFDVKWIDQEKLDYQKISDSMVEVHSRASRGDYDEAEEIIDELKDEGYEREGIVLDSFVSGYRD